MPFYVVKKNIIDFDTDAIVNSANPFPIIEEGVERHIYDKAGMELLRERQSIGEIKESTSVISNAYHLDSKYVIHTVAPYYQDNSEFKQKLANAYLSALELCVKHNIESIAFPLLASGTNQCPRNTAIEIAIDTITRFIREVDLEVYLVLYKPYRSKGSLDVSRQVQNYISDKRNDSLGRTRNNISHIVSKNTYFDNTDSIEDIFDSTNKSFQEQLFQIIDERNLNEIQVYKNANISRKLFSKIRSDRHYQPTKRTILALCISLRLNLEETRELLKSAGYYLTRSIEFDLMIIFFIEKKLYKIDDINLILFEYGKPLLGSK